MCICTTNIFDPETQIKCNTICFIIIILHTTCRVTHNRIVPTTILPTLNRSHCIERQC